MWLPIAHTCERTSKGNGVIEAAQADHALPWSPACCVGGISTTTTLAAYSTDICLFGLLLKQSHDAEE